MWSLLNSKCVEGTILGKFFGNATASFGSASSRDKIAVTVAALPMQAPKRYRRHSSPKSVCGLFLEWRWQIYL